LVSTISSGFSTEFRKLPPRAIRPTTSSRSVTTVCASRWRWPAKPRVWTIPRNPSIHRWFGPCAACRPSPSRSSRVLTACLMGSRSWRRAGATIPCLRSPRRFILTCCRAGGPVGPIRPGTPKNGPSPGLTLCVGARNHPRS